MNEHPAPRMIETPWGEMIEDEAPAPIETRPAVAIAQGTVAAVAIIVGRRAMRALAARAAERTER